MGGLLQNLLQSIKPQVGAGPFGTPSPIQGDPGLPGGPQGPGGGSDLLQLLFRAKLAEASGGADVSGMVPGMQQEDSDQDLSALTEISPSKVRLDPNAMDQKTGKNAIDEMTGMTGEGPYPKPKDTLHKVGAALRAFGLGMEGPQGQSVLAREKGEQSEFEKARALYRSKWQQEQDTQQHQTIMENEQRRKDDLLDRSTKEREKRLDRIDAENRDYQRQEEARKTAEDKARDAKSAATEAETGRHNLATERHGQAMEGLVARGLQDKEDKAAAAQDQITPQAQKILTETGPVHDTIRDLKSRLEAYREDDTPGYMGGALGKEALKYKFGMAGKESPAAIGDVIAELNMARVVGGARVLKGSSRAIQALEMAMKHLPNPMTDSGKKMYGQLDQLDQALTQIENEATTYGKKGQTMGEAKQMLNQSRQPGQGQRRVIDLTK